MTDDELEAIRERAEAATERPWETEVESNAVFVDTARPDMLALLGEVAFLKTLLHDRIEDSDLAELLKRERADQEARLVELRRLAANLVVELRYDGLVSQGHIQAARGILGLLCDPPGDTLAIRTAEERVEKETGRA